MSPKRYFGTPMVGTTGYSAETLWNAAHAEGDTRIAAEYYEVTHDNILAACEYFKEDLKQAA